MFQGQDQIERFKVMYALLGCKKQENGYMSTHTLKMKAYFYRPDCLGLPFTQELTIDVILNSLTSAYKQVVINYYMNGLEKSIMELHGMLKTVEESVVPPRNSNSVSPMLAIREGGVKRKSSSHPKAKGKGNGKLVNPS